MYPRGGACTVTVAYPTYGFAARKNITKVVSDGEINPIVFFLQNHAKIFTKGEICVKLTKQNERNTCCEGNFNMQLRILRNNR